MPLREKNARNAKSDARTMSQKCTHLLMTHTKEILSDIDTQRQMNHTKEAISQNCTTTN